MRPMQDATGRNRPTRRAGISAIYLLLVFTVLFAFTSLGVDLGRVQVVKTELQRAADAAARYGMSGLRTGVARAERNAIEAARENNADGSPVVLRPDEDVEFGRWDARARAFTALRGADRSGANAVRVTARRTAARGNGVPLTFASFLGMDSCDVRASAVAIRGGYTLVGINAVSLNGVARIDSYSSAAGPYSAATAGDKAVVVSNGNINLSGNPAIRGEAHPGPGGSINGAASVTGSTAPLGTFLNFPMPEVDSAYNNGPISSMLRSGGKDLILDGNKTYTIPTGTYAVRNLTLAGTARLRISGAVTIYVSGDLSISGGLEVVTGRPGDFRIRMTSANTTAAIGGNSALYADLYAPGSTVTVSGTGDFYGTVVGKTLSVSGRAGIHYDEAVFPYGGNSGIALVK